MTVSFTVISILLSNHWCSIVGFWIENPLKDNPCMLCLQHWKEQFKYVALNNSTKQSKHQETNLKSALQTMNNRQHNSSHGDFIGQSCSLHLNYFRYTVGCLKQNVKEHTQTVKDMTSSSLDVLAFLNLDFAVHYYWCRARHSEA